MDRKLFARVNYPSAVLIRQLFLLWSTITAFSPRSDWEFATQQVSQVFWRISSVVLEYKRVLSQRHVKRNAIVSRGEP